MDDVYALDPDFVRGSGSFTFKNGDQYEGEYCAHRTGVVWREGTGTYKTKDGQLYTGQWRDDKLFEEGDTEVSYPSGVRFIGKIVKNKYEGAGMYTLENQMSLLCAFTENKPVGDLTLIDIKGKQWHGKADEFTALLLPEHVYYDNIHPDLGKGESRNVSEMKHHKSSQSSQTSQLSQISEEPKSISAMNELRSKIFRKTKKTPSDLKFEASDWYTNFVEFKNVFENIKDKINENGKDSLDDNEKLWYKRYQEFKKKYNAIINAKKQNKTKLSEHKLFELYNSEEFKNSCRPLSVFYPTYPNESPGAE